MRDRARRGGRCARPAACCRRRTTSASAAALSRPVTRKQTSRAPRERRVGEGQPAGPQLGDVDGDRQPVLAPPAPRCPGNSEAVCPSGPRPEQRQVEPGRRGARAQRQLVVARGGVEVGGLGAPAEDVGSRDARRVEQRLARHAVVRLRVVGRHRALVAEEDVGARPVDAVDQLRVERARRRAAGQRDAEPPARRDGGRGEPRGCAPRPRRPARGDRGDDDVGRGRAMRRGTLPRRARLVSAAAMVVETVTMGAFEELSWRGLVQQTTAENMAEVLAKPLDRLRGLRSDGAPACTPGTWCRSCC